MEGYTPLPGGACNPIHEDYKTLYVRCVEVSVSIPLQPTLTYRQKTQPIHVFRQYPQ